MKAELKVRTDRWLPGISRLSGAAASAVLLIGAAVACGANPRPTSGVGPDGAVTTQVLPLSAVYILEISGLAPNDTSLAFKVGEPRTVILRHGAPDFGVFATLVFPADVFSGSGADSVRITVKPRPGIYGVDFECDVPVGPGATLTFKYPVHFLAPAGAVQRYGGVAAMERALLIGRQTGNGDYALLASTRPAPDNLQAPLSGPGGYVVAAPR